jgi:curved DNA-binding protein CbpA
MRALWKIETARRKSRARASPKRLPRLNPLYFAYVDVCSIKEFSRARRPFPPFCDVGDDSFSFKIYHEVFLLVLLLLWKSLFLPFASIEAPLTRLEIPKSNPQRRNFEAPQQRSSSNDMTRDPYKTLGLPHNASAGQIKQAYRKLALQLHPDRLTRQNITEDEKKEAEKRFADIASAYQLLADGQRKRQYDHIYKYGGFDEEEENEPPTVRRTTAQPTTFHQPNATPRNSYRRAKSAPPGGFSPFPTAADSQKRSTGIGYTVTDPFAFVLSGGKNRSAAVAGIQIPSRVHLGHNPPGGGIRLAFSSGKFEKQKDGGKKCVTKTTQFVHGKKYSKVETTTIHPDGRKEILIEGNDYVERRISSPPKKKSRRKEQDKNVAAKKDEPWYIGAWRGIQDKLSMCHNPCAAIIAH